MINEIFPNQLNTQYDALKEINDSDYVLHYNARSILLKVKGETLEIPQKKDIPNLTDQNELVYLFRLNDKACFLIKEHFDMDNLSLAYHDVNIFRTLKQEKGWVCLLGFQLHNWYQNHQFCGKCGAPTQHKTDERALLCPSCQNTIYPSISPAIIVAIICNENILLARGAKWPDGRFSLVAGYTDVGESLEETVIREVKEEVGIDIKNIRYYKNHPWPLSGSLMVGFVAEADDQQPIIIDDKEIAEAAWFSKENLPPHSPEISISGEMIDRFRKGEL